MQQCVIAVAMRDCSNSQMVLETNMQQCVIAVAMRDCSKRSDGFRDKHAAMRDCCSNA